MRRALPAFLLAIPLLAGCATLREPYGARRPPPEVAAAQKRFAAASPSEAEAAAMDTLRLDDTFEPACHNCYDPDLLDRFAHLPGRVGSGEVDLFDRWMWRFGGSRGAWYVRHSGWGSYSNCADRGTGGGLDACLRSVRRWVEAEPPGRPMVVFLDKKQAWSPGRSPRVLDSLIASALPRERVLTPRELRGAHATVRAGAEADGWPRVGAMHGRVVLVLTGPNARLREYVDSVGDDALAFVAPDVRSAAEVDGVPAGFDERSVGAVAAYNFAFRRPMFAIGERAHARHFLTRVWSPFTYGVLETTDPCKFVAAGLNRVARFWTFDPFPSVEYCDKHPPRKGKGKQGRGEGG